MIFANCFTWNDISFTMNGKKKPQVVALIDKNGLRLIKAKIGPRSDKT